MLEQKANKFMMIGPCSMESYQQMELVAQTAKKIGTPYLRAQLFKPRTNPNTFQGLGIEGVSILEKLRSKYSIDEIKFICEICSEKQFELASPYMSVVQIGARNMQNYELLKFIGANFDHEYVLLKRGFANNLEEWCYSAQYLINEGVPKEKILLCERGSRSLTSPTGTHLDFLCALEAKRLGFKVIIDPSHGTKKSEYVIPMAKAAMALEMDGLMIECHPEPAKSVSDAFQAISLKETEDFFTTI